MIGSGISGLGAAYLLSRAHDVQVLERDARAGGHARTVRRDGLALDTGFLVHNERNYPLLTRLFRELGRRDAGVGDVVLGLVPGCGLEYSGRRPFAQRSPRRRPALPPPALGDRPLAPDGETVARRARLRELVARPLPRRAPLLRAVPAPLPRPSHRRALVDGARPRARVSGGRARSASSTTTGCSASALPLAVRDRRQRHLRRRDRGSGSATGCSSVSAPVRSAATPTVSSCTTDDGASCAVRRGRHRDPRRPGARAARGSVR